MSLGDSIRAPRHQMRGRCRGQKQADRRRPSVAGAELGATLSCLSLDSSLIFGLKKDAKPKTSHGEQRQCTAARPTTCTQKTQCCTLLSPSGASHSSATTVCTVAAMEKGAGAKVRKHFFDFIAIKSLLKVASLISMYTS